MAQLPSSRVIEPFGEVNVWTQADGSLRVKATVLMTPAVEGAQTGLAIDGSASMKSMFGVGGAVSALFAPATPNVVEPVARTLASYLANFDSDGGTTVIYWACGPGGADVEEVGDMDSAAAKTKSFTAPKHFGTGTRLLPAVRYFTEQKFASADWGIFVFITDGIIEDLADVQAYTLQLAQQIAAGQRKFVKLVLIGVGSEVDEGQMEALDDMDYGGLRTPEGHEIDLWDHKLASEMQKIEEIFAEVVSADTILAPSADVLDSAGNHVRPNGVGSYKDGLPALLDFNVPAGTTSFTLVLPGGQRVEQDITL